MVADGNIENLHVARRDCLGDSQCGPPSYEKDRADAPRQPVSLDGEVCGESRVGKF